MTTSYKRSTIDILKNKNLLLLFQGIIISNFGNAVYGIAVIWFILSNTNCKNSGIFLAFFSICWMLPGILCSPIAGALVDRLNRKQIIVYADFFSGVFMLILAVFTYYNVAPMISLMVVTFASSIINSFFNPAIGSILPNIVEKKELLQANSIKEMVYRIAFIVGAAIAGFIYYKFGIVGVFIINSISFLVSSVLSSFIELSCISLKEKSKSKVNEFIKDIIGGLQYIKNDSPIFILFIYSLFFNFICAPFYVILVPKAIKFNLGLTAWHLGIIESIYSIGTLLGSMIMLFISKKEKLNCYKITFFSFIMFAILILIYGIPIFPNFFFAITAKRIFFIYCIISFLFMFFNCFINIPIFTIFQKRIPEEYLGRFFSLLTTFCLSMVPLSNALFGYFSTFIPTAYLMIVLGILTVLAVILFLLSDQIRQLYFEATKFE